MNINEKIFNEMISKLGMNKNERLTSKSIEILELLKIKSSEILRQLSENAKIILCIDISCELLNLPFAENSQALLIAGTKKPAYNKNRKIIQKVLDLNKKLTIDDVIRKLGISSQSSAVEKTAKDIFKVYMQQQYENQDCDPSIFVMSVYFACKFENVKVPKKSVINLSNLTQNQWYIMEKSWEKLTSALNKKNKETKKSLSESTKENISEQDKQDTTVIRNNKKTETAEESYDVWAKRILDKAYEELRSS